MEKDFKEIVRQKTTDELVRIVIYKEEYKNELVQEAEAELKSRDLKKEPNTIVQIPQPVVISKGKETPFEIYIAGILLFISAPIWLFIGLIQAGASSLGNNATLGVYSMWNTFFAVFSIVCGVGILKGKKWGYEWGTGTAIINILWFGYLYYEHQNMFLIFLIVLEFIVALILVVNKKYFNEEPIIAQGFPVTSSNSSADQSEHQQDIIHLHNLIQAEKGNAFGSSKRDEIRGLIEKLCTSKEASEYLLRVYQQVYLSNLIEDLKKLSNSYDRIKEYCKVFIDFGVVSKNYPHERLS